MGITNCPECGGVISLRFPAHSCKSVFVLDGDKQKLVKKITIEERGAMVEKLKKTYEDVGIDANGDIVFYEYL